MILYRSPCTNIFQHSIQNILSSLFVYRIEHTQGGIDGRERGGKRKRKMKDKEDTLTVSTPTARNVITTLHERRLTYTLTAKKFQ